MNPLENWEKFPPPGYIWYENKRAFGLITEECSSFWGDLFWEPRFLDQYLHQHIRGKPLILEREGKKIVLKFYRRGGILGKIASHLMWGKKRVFQDFQAYLFLQTQKILVPKPLGALVFPKGLWKIHLLVTSYWESYCNLRDFYIHHAPVWETHKKRLLIKMARLIRQVHDAGFYHGDLNLMNLVIHRKELALTMLDFDRSQIHSALTLNQRWQNLMRLYRSACKLHYQGKFGEWTKEDTLIFLKAYWGDDISPKETLKEWQRRSQHFWLHKIFW